MERGVHAKVVQRVREFDAVKRLPRSLYYDTMGCTTSSLSDLSLGKGMNKVRR